MYRVAKSLKVIIPTTFWWALKHKPLSLQVQKKTYKQTLIENLITTRYACPNYF